MVMAVWSDSFVDWNGEYRRMKPWTVVLNASLSVPVKDEPKSKIEARPSALVYGLS
jgi:hypothetical protein